MKKLKEVRGYFTGAMVPLYFYGQLNIFRLVYTTNQQCSPFAATKPRGQGMGLGLSSSYDIIKPQGGELQVQSKEGEFADFSFQLPT
jgi:signal transduction histidine kinase